jgi:hypothetical protein
MSNITENKPQYSLKDWSVIVTFKKIKLGGIIFGHARFNDGSYVCTSRIKSINKREITTKSGSIYHLEGEPLPWYWDVVQKNHPDVDLNNPLDYLKESINND